MQPTGAGALADHPTRRDAQIAYLQGVEALLRHPDCPRGQIAWLRCQSPAALSEDGWILVTYPTQEAATRAGASEAIVRLGHCLRREGIAAGIYTYAPEAAPATPQPPPWERQPLYMPAFLVATTLPHRDPGAGEFSRVNGKVQTTLVSTKRAGLPFGIYPRLIVIHLATAAVRTKSRRFRVGRSINELLRQMRIGEGGGKGGQSTLARDQLDRLCTTTFITTHSSKYGGHKVDVADRWLEKTASGLEVDLSERFYDKATKSAVPLDPVILRAVRRSPLSIDAYGWLTYRMATLQEPAAIPWRSLEKQFGSEYSRPRDFRRRFSEAVERVKAVWPGDLGIEIQERRVILTPGPPSVDSRRERSNAKHH